MGQQLARGADTFAAASWSGAGFGASAELEISVEFARITGGLDQSGSSIASLDINPTAKGLIGGPDAGPLILNANATANSRVRNAGRVDAYLQADTKVEHIHNGHPQARSRLLGGEFETGSISAGRLTATGSTVIDEFYGLGGKSHLAYGASAGALTFMELVNGHHALERRADLIIVGQGATLDLDPDAAVDWAADVGEGIPDAEILIYGGTVIWRDGILPKIKALGGVIDFRYARGPMSGLGSTSFELIGTQVYEHPDVDLSNAVTPPAIFRTTSGGTQVGGFTPAPS